MLKSTLLLATALFLITAPAPDAADLAEATHGLIAATGAAALQAAEPADASALPTAAAHPQTLGAPDRCNPAATAP